MDGSVVQDFRIKASIGRVGFEIFADAAPGNGGNQPGFTTGGV